MSIFVVSIQPPNDVIAITQNHNTINLSWTAVANADSYNIYISDVLTASVDTNSYSATGLAPETTYNFNVSSVLGASESEKSSTVSATTNVAPTQTPVGGGSIPPYVGVEKLAQPSGGFKVVINDNLKKTNNRSVILSLSGGPEATKVRISDFEDFRTSLISEYKEKKPWVLPKEDGEKKIYVRFLDDNDNFSPIITGSIILDTTPPKIEVDKIKDSFSVDEEIILSGSVNEPGEVLIAWENKYGLVVVDKNLKWAANLGKIPSGEYLIPLTAKDEVENAKTVVLNIYVDFPNIPPVAPAIPQQPGKVFPLDDKNDPKLKQISLWERIRNIFFKERISPILIVVPKVSPLALRGDWKFISLEKRFGK